MFHVSQDSRLCEAARATDAAAAQPVSVRGGDNINGQPDATVGPERQVVDAVSYLIV
ncbi:hypothetical protein CBM2609_A20002 [Cupriavidus taiwanensis]|nr:hypothetical protein CBM2604_A20002 [Cupriavidus taiwanensis]SOZ26341.1 hypothetical protein CBM2609_A20002 [Cupriavidus taiwanensis]SOZ53084.1 hypothetical protein CBM2610_U20002 [Cupriavidus taiwanensis]